MSSAVTRRDLLQTLAWGTAGLMVGSSLENRPARAATSAKLADASSIRYCLNTSTIRGQKLPLWQEVDLVADAGYDAIEPWINEIQAHVADGKTLADLKKKIADRGLTVESAIGFAAWIVDDDAKRAEGVESLKRDMDLVRQLGGTRIAAPPVGATNQTDLNLQRAAERYAVIMEVGREMGVTPQLEVWGFSKSLSRLSEVMQVAIESGCPDACVLPDVYHLFKGGTDFRSLAMVPGSVIQVMHLNDYPGDIPRDTIADKDRVYPGDGVAPLAKIIYQLRKNGFDGVFSLELFNPSYWERPVTEVLTKGLAGMQAAVAASSAVSGWTEE
ncbi:MAG: sugar phosphate isomerase/epimerase [Planctomycetales bacterium]|nr:sugar phosphate isomerase/epimerase [Planctomycetales bacterium]MCA9171214.1 sugar phosphate isomerase/epimerase [Planctomycetales bacterium]